MKATTFVAVSLLVSCGPSSAPAPAAPAAPVAHTPSTPTATTGGPEDAFCGALTRAVTDLPSDFASLRGEVVQRGPGQSPIWVSSLVLGDRGDVSIMRDRGYLSVSWEADGEGMDQLRTLRTRLEACAALAAFTLEPFEPTMEGDDPDFRTVYTWEASAPAGFAELEYMDPGVTFTLWRK